MDCESDSEFYVQDEDDLDSELIVLDAERHVTYGADPEDELSEFMDEHSEEIPSPEPSPQPQPNGVAQLRLAARREDVAAKRHHREKATQLEARATRGIKEVTSFLKSASRRVGLNEQEVKGLLHLHSELQQARQEEKRDMSGCLGQMKKGIAALERLVVDGGAGYDFMQQLQCQMDDIELSISDFKNQQRSLYEELAAEEQSLTRAMDTLEQKLEAWSAPPTVAPEMEIAPGSRTRVVDAKAPFSMAAEEKRPAAVVEYELFLAERGPTGGWDPRDHRVFEQLRKHYEQVPELLLMETVRQVPGQSRETVMEHMQWHSEFTHLEAGRKQAIADWKQRQQQAREREIEVQAHEAEEKKKPSEHALRKQKIDDDYRAQQAEKLRRWKADKAQHEADQHKAAELERKRATAKKEAEAAARTQTKQALEQYKQHKMETRRVSTPVEEHRQRPLSAAQLEAVQRRGEEREQARREAIDRVKKKDEERERRVELAALKANAKVREKIKTTKKAVSVTQATAAQKQRDKAHMQELRARSEPGGRLTQFSAAERVGRIGGGGRANASWRGRM